MAAATRCRKIMTTHFLFFIFISLVTECGGLVDHSWVVIELRDLKGREKLAHRLEALIVMEGIE